MSKSGVSGAGKKSELAYSFSELFGNFKAYGVGQHRHEPEIRQGLHLGDRATLVFVPHLLPTVRGILSTIHVGFTRPLSAEEMTRVWCTERRVRRVILRVPGIYGPGRLPLERLKQREPVVCPEDAGISNRIHVDDLVMACERAVLNREARGVYNVTDGNSISSTAFFDAVARIANLPAPPRVSMEEAQLTFSPERLSFLNESRRVGNERMLKHLGVTLQYANIEAGIRASLDR